jgi:uncharacterized membrane protein YkvA (DUF1232 family)
MDKRLSGSNIIPSQGNVLRDFALRSRLILRLMADGRISFLLKLLPVGALAYLISPIDFIPAAVAPIIGTVDDVAIVWLGLALFLEMCPPGVVREHLKNLLSSSQISGEEGQAANDESEIVDGEVTDIK